MLKPLEAMKSQQKKTIEKKLQADGTNITTDIATYRLNNGRGADTMKIISNKIGR